MKKTFPADGVIRIELDSADGDAFVPAEFMNADGDFLYYNDDGDGYAEGFTLPLR